MTIHATQAQYLGKPVVEFRMGDTLAHPEQVRSTAYRLVQDYDSEESQEELLDAFLAQIDVAALDTLIIGAWSEAHEDSPQDYLDALIARRAQLTGLRHLFVGDMTYEDCEISWIIQGDYTPLLAAFPHLQSLRIRGSTQLSLAPFVHGALESLAIECGGLPNTLVQAIAAARMASLRRLELWLGDENYGFDGDVAVYADLLARIDAQRLSYLGLRNAPISDALASHLAQQPWLGRLHTLDLSMGTLGDEGAQALCASPHLQGLDTLDLSHHYISAAWQAKLKALPCIVVLNDPQDAADNDGERYVEVSE